MCIAFISEVIFQVLLFYILLEPRASLDKGHAETLITNMRHSRNNSLLP